MGKLELEFRYDKSVDTLIEGINDWLNNTTEGKRWGIKTSKSGEIIKIKRGKGFFTAPVYNEFWLKESSDGFITIAVLGYILNISFIIPFKQSLDGNAKFGGLPRRNGWKDLMKLLQYLNVKDYTVIRQ